MWGFGRRERSNRIRGLAFFIDKLFDDIDLQRVLLCPARSTDYPPSVFRVEPNQYLINLKESGVVWFCTPLSIDGNWVFYKCRLKKILSF